MNELRGLIIPNYQRESTMRLAWTNLSVSNCLFAKKEDRSVLFLSDYQITVLAN